MTALEAMREVSAELRAAERASPWMWLFAMQGGLADRLEKLIKQAEQEHMAARREAALLALCSAKARERGFPGFVM